MNLKYKISIQLVAGLFFFGVAYNVNAKANQQTLVAPIGNIGILQAPDPPPPGGPHVYGATGPSPNWSIAQWNIPGGQLSAFRSSDATNNEWVASSAEAKVSVSGPLKNRSVTLWQDGAVLPCTTSAGKPRESDLFLSANSGGLHAPSILAMEQKGRSTETLSELQALMIKAQISILEGLSKTQKGCEVNQGSALIGLILTSDVHSHKQTLFYKVILDKLCGLQSPERAKTCAAAQAEQVYYARDNPYGVNDFLNLIGGSLMSGQSQRSLELNLLPRLIEAIKNGPKDMDRNPSHWSVTGFYVGQAIWGDVTLRSSWINLQLLADRAQ